MNKRHIPHEQPITRNVQASHGPTRSLATYDLPSTIAHDLRTPLTSIVGFAHALLADSSVEDETRERIGEILRTEGERLSRTVEELTRTSTVQLTRVKDLLSESDLSTVLATVARFAAKRFPSKTFCVSYALAPGTSLPAVRSGDLFSATFYLVSAIARMTYDHLPITLGLQTSSDRPVVTIGCQFAAQPSGQHNGTKPFGDVRLASTIAERVVEHYGGTVCIESSLTGETVFTLEFHV